MLVGFLIKKSEVKKANILIEKIAHFNQSVQLGKSFLNTAKIFTPPQKKNQITQSTKEPILEASYFLEAIM